jgi:hypothetical protein
MDESFDLSQPHLTPPSGLSGRYLTHDCSNISEWLFAFENLPSGGLCRAECWVLLPSNLQLHDIALCFLGFQTKRYVAPSLIVRDQWQLISVEAVVPAEQTRAVVRLSMASEGPCTVYSMGWQFGQVVVSSEQVVSLTIAPISLFEETVAEQKGQVVRISRSGQGFDLDISPVEFGHVTEPVNSLREFPPNSWSQRSYAIQSRPTYELDRAIVYGEQGLVRIGDNAVLETIRLVAFDSNQSKFTRIADNVIAIDRECDFKLSRAAYVFSGFPGNRNYAHWLVDMVPALLSASADLGAYSSPILFPKVRYRYQLDTLNLFPEIKARLIYLSDSSIACIDTLVIGPHLLRDPGHFPTPAIIDAALQIKDRLGIQSAKRFRRIYISRRDSSARRMLNEEDLIETLCKYGFEIVSLSDLSFESQVRLFSEAVIVVASHGAGLANLIFCSPVTFVLELFVESYVQWSMRRLGSLISVRYGCIVGNEVGFSVGQHGKVWIVDIGLVESTLSRMLACIPSSYN